MINQVKGLSVIEKDRSDGGTIFICGLSPSVNVYATPKHTFTRAFQSKPYRSKIALFGSILELRLSEIRKN